MCLVTLSKQEELLRLEMDLRTGAWRPVFPDGVEIPFHPNFRIKAVSVGPAKHAVHGKSYEVLDGQACITATWGNVGPLCCLGREGAYLFQLKDGKALLIKKLKHHRIIS
jgi:hypothetical protein